MRNRDFRDFWNRPPEVSLRVCDDRLIYCGRIVKGCPNDVNCCAHYEEHFTCAKIIGE